MLLTALIASKLWHSMFTATTFENLVLTFKLACIPGKHEGQVYIQTSEPFNPAQQNLAARIGDVDGNAVAQRPKQVTWRPYLTSSPSRTPTVVTKDLAVWNPLEYPFGKLHDMLVATKSGKILWTHLDICCEFFAHFFTICNNYNYNFAGLFLW